MKNYHFKLLLFICLISFCLTAKANDIYVDYVTGEVVIPDRDVKDGEMFLDMNSGEMIYPQTINDDNDSSVEFIDMFTGRFNIYGK